MPPGMAEQGEDQQGDGPRDYRPRYRRPQDEEGGGQDRNSPQDGERNGVDHEEPQYQEHDNEELEVSYTIFGSIVTDLYNTGSRMQ